MNKTFKDYYLTESKKTFDFKVKIAGEITNEQEDTLKELLAKYQVVAFKKASKTPVQALPLDFPRLTNTEVNIWEVSLNYPVASWELQNYIGNGLKIIEQQIVVRNPHEPLEQYQEPSERREGALLTDSEYKESQNVDSKDYYGTEYNTSLIKTLNAELKAQHKARGQVIPNGDDGKTTNEIAQNNQSPVGSK